MGAGAWIAAELVVGFTAGLIYAVGVEFWGWPSQSTGFNLLVYLIALAGALGSVTIVSRILTRRPVEESFLPPPPPPQEFPDSKANHDG